MTIVREYVLGKSVRTFIYQILTIYSFSCIVDYLNKSHKLRIRTNLISVFIYI